MWINADLIYWHIYVALGGDELIKLSLFISSYHFMYMNYSEETCYIYKSWKKKKMLFLW